jgi:cardiolipin synthase (CMP-forming)
LLGIDTRPIGTLLVYVAALLTLWSMGYYLRRSMPWIAEKEG